MKSEILAMKLETLVVQYFWDIYGNFSFPIKVRREKAKNTVVRGDF